jgi:enoyl-[acyl-carrier protein] reductase I
MSFLQLEGKRFLVFGVANRKSVAWAAGRRLEDEGAEVLYSVRSQERKESLTRLMGQRQVEVCDVEFPEQTEALAKTIEASGKTPLDGILHSIAFADYSEGFQPFHLTPRPAFLQATAISSFSLVEIARAFKPLLDADASVVSIGISSTVVTADNYGYMSPIKASLEGCVRYLAKSFSADTRIRFNTVNAGPLKTSASAGIPGYAESYLYAEKMTLRKQAVQTGEVADTAAFLLSPRSSGINGSGIVVNAGMDLNYFDQDLIKLAMRPEKEPRSGNSP